jgi:hypothetical protein
MQAGHIGRDLKGGTVMLGNVVDEDRAAGAIFIRMARIAGPLGP